MTTSLLKPCASSLTSYEQVGGLESRTTTLARGRHTWKRPLQSRQGRGALGPPLRPGAASGGMEIGAMGTVSALSRNSPCWWAAFLGQGQSTEVSRCGEHGAAQPQLLQRTWCSKAQQDGDWLKPEARKHMLRELGFGLTGILMSCSCESIPRSELNHMSARKVAEPSWDSQNLPFWHPGSPEGPLQSAPLEAPEMPHSAQRVPEFLCLGRPPSPPPPWRSSSAPLRGRPSRLLRHTFWLNKGATA